MKKICIVLVTGRLIACHGNENAETKPTDLDQTKNNDTSAVKTDSSSNIRKDSTDTTHL